MYRSRTGESLDKDAFEFLSSAETDSHLLYYDVLGSEAHVIMLYEIGLLAPSNLGKLLYGLERIRENPNILSTEKFEDIHECVEAQLISELGYEVGGTLQTARSRNDQVILDIRMMIRDLTNNTSREVVRFISALLSKSKDNLHSIMPMYTHLQQAQLGTFSHFLLSYVDTLFRDLDRLNGMYNRINYSPLGACAIGGTSININRERTASLLGFKDHPFRRANNGAHGSGKKQHGRSGSDLIVPVPEGTVVLDAVVTAPSGTPAPGIAEVAAACV